MPTQDVTNPVSLSSYNTQLKPNLTLQTNLQQHVDPSSRAIQGVGQLSHSLVGIWVCVLPGAWIFVACECCVLSGRGLCVGLITRPEESYRVWCVWVWSRSAVRRGGQRPELGRSTTEKNYINTLLFVNLYGNLQTRLLPSDQNNASRPRPVQRIVGRSLSCAPDRTCL